MPIYFLRPQDASAQLLGATFEAPLGQMDFHIQNLFHRGISAPPVLEDSSGNLFWAQPWYIYYFDKNGNMVYLKIPPQSGASTPQLQLTSGKALVAILDDGSNLSLSQNINAPTVLTAVNPPAAPGQYGIITTTSIGLVPLAQNTNNAYNLILATKTSHAPTVQVQRSPHLNNTCFAGFFDITGTSNQTGTNTFVVGNTSDWPTPMGSTDYFFRLQALNQNAVGLLATSASLGGYALAKATTGVTLTYNRASIANAAVAHFSYVVEWQ